MDGNEEETELERTKLEIKNALKEYLVSHEVKEVERTLEELEVPHFHHEVGLDSMRA